jgi:SpoVK/Ycf46/Vps4 family AAA+-type ATPase
MQKFRQVEPDRPLVCVFEDIDAIIKQFGDAELLQWLDGNHQVNRAVNLATTNYPEKLDRRIVSRPRRFDRILKIESPEDPLRDAYFARKMPELSETERAEWVRLSAALSFASLSEMIISVQCMGHTLEETAKLLQELESNTPSSSEWGTAVEANPAPVNGEPYYQEETQY